MSNPLHEREAQLKADAHSPKKESIWRIVAINIVVLICLLGVLEIGARAYIAWTYGSQTAGMQERTAYLSYEPFVMYGPKWDQLFGSLQLPKRDVCRVMVVGGSVAQGFPDKVLESALANAYPGKTFKAINAAYGGYEARQEVVVASLWGPRLKPDLLLSLDGHNDLDHRLRVKKAGEFYLSSTYETFLGSPLSAPFYFLAGQSQVYNAMQRFFARRQVGAVAQYSDAIPVYIDALESLNRLAAGMGAARLMVLQPFVSYKTPLSTEEAAFTLYKYREGVMKELYGLAGDQIAALSKQDGTPYLDGRFIYADVPGHVFVDDVHLTPEGYQLLARAIATSLVSTWSARCAQ